jgi:all-trans-retinol dehydrogenase (NAD+)
VTFYQCDITDSEAVQDTCKQIRTRHGDATVLVNNAGIGTKGRSVLEVCTLFSSSEGFHR